MVTDQRRDGAPHCGEHTGESVAEMVDSPLAEAMKTPVASPFVSVELETGVSTRVFDDIGTDHRYGEWPVSDTSTLVPRLT